MNIHELFEQHFADQHGVDVEAVKAQRLSNGSYGMAQISTDFRYFKAGFEANQGEKMQVLGYLSNTGALRPGYTGAIYLHRNRVRDIEVECYVKQCDTHNKGEKS